MKKFGALLLCILATCFIIPCFLKIDAKASHKNGDTVQTDIFLPTSYLQYYNLVNPYAICRYKDQNEEFVAISQENSIVIYKNEKFSKIDLLNVDDTQVTTLQRYENYLLYLYDSVIWALDITDFDTVGWTPPTAEKIANPNGNVSELTSNSSFSVCGDKIVCSTNTYVYLYQLSKDSFGKLTVSEIDKVKPNCEVSKLLLSQSGNVYFSKTEGGISIWNGTEVLEFDGEASNVRTLVESENGNAIYYSCSSGIYSINTITKTKTTVKTISANDANADLGAIYEPQGICLYGDKLWVVDSKIMAVQEIDLTNGNEFTEFAITTNSYAVNRLTSNARDIVIDRDKIYALDQGRIVVIGNVSDKEQSYSRINLTTSQIDAFSAGNGFVCFANDNVISICKIVQSDSQGVEYQVENVYSRSLSNEDKVVDVAFSEGVFYAIYNKTYESQTHPYVCKINVKQSEYTLEKVVFEDTEIGSAVQIVADVFGTVYYCSENGGNYNFYSYDGNSVKLINSKPTTSKILNLQTDFDGKLYALYENNVIDVIEENSITTKTLETSSNLGAINPAKSMCLSCNSKTAYFIFEGLILNSAVTTELNISTPYSIEIPSGFSFDFNENQTFVKVKQGAKLFKVNAKKTGGKHFDFIGYSEAKSSDTDYAVISLNDKFSLLIKENTVAVARNSDLLTPLKTVEKTQSSGYAIVDFKIYSLPVLQEEFLISSSNITFGTKVETVGFLTFNDTEFLVVTDGENTGYIPKTFLVDNIVTDDGTTEISDVYVYKKGGITVYDADGNSIGSINKKTKVTVLKRGNTLAIIYGDDVGYIDSDCIVSSSSADVLKAVAVIIASLSALVTILYFEFRYLFRKN
ncbi:MAG: hypothetical protein IJC87_01215 [Clostridia bacterium]|nr:hypothetical protein [Clostridia bacterium]